VDGKEAGFRIGRFLDVFMKPTLLILAAGIGSRYGGMKQIDQVGPSGEAIIDYSVYDAIRTGFGKIVFVIRKQIEKDIREFFEHKLAGKIQMEYVYQELNMIPEGYTVPPERIKPWGTAHAVWVAAKAIKEPFVAINADDFYGLESYRLMAEYLTSRSPADSTNFCMIGYRIQDTLSEYGSVSRGVCESDDQLFLKTVVERPEIFRKDGEIAFRDEHGSNVLLSADTLVSMNIWGFTPAIFNHIGKQFTDFIRENVSNIKAELYIPSIVNYIVKNGKGNVKILPAKDKWFGVTYKEDKQLAVQNIRKLIEKGIYPEKLWT
jgi:UTP-glucose-1-phosphate uridylyltransferase